ncbi:MAG: 50S ribosomal protein L9 [Deltaproteobacteria bacterium HGW-Deltaproteobacteria-15]|jgi:large subunit ribosomal protein L9|nr:50S ribosomal protein L9 [Desulfobacterales bacterium]PKN64477.1 MAG: 50S ribosomal protein L9 [Deltaproteobacteria bacterium HGW-Deltaproteobacteria-15]
MKIILKQDVDSLGMVGQTFEVKEGYARNYLIPKGIALEATKQNIRLMESQKKSIEEKRLKAKDEAEKAKQSLSELVLTIAQKVGEEDKLYGSVTSMDIADHLEKKGVALDRKRIKLDRPIKTLGEFMVPVKLHPEVTATIKVVVVPLETA